MTGPNAPWPPAWRSCPASRLAWDSPPRSAIILRKAIEAGLSRGRSMDAIVAAVVYLAAKQLGAPRGLHELAEATGVTVHRISLTAKVVSRELGVFSRASRAEDFVPRF